MVRIYTAVLFAAFFNVLFYTGGRNLIVYKVKNRGFLTEADVRKTNGFSLLELMIALGALTIIATVSVPKVQVWNARNRGLQTVMEIISDFSKARSVAGYTVVGDDTNGYIDIPLKVKDSDGLPDGSGTMKVYLGIRLQTAIVFGLHDYSIYQKKDMANTAASWQNSTLLKKNLLMDSVSIESVNNITEHEGFSRRLVFNSNGMVKTNLDDFPNLTPEKCGSSDNHLKKMVMSAVVRSKIGGSDDSIWYRIDIDKSGEYFVCTSFSSNFADATANPLSI